MPVLQLSMRTGLDADEHCRMGKVLGSLRNRGMLIICSGSAVHNYRELGLIGPTETPPAWASEFQDWYGTTPQSVCLLCTASPCARH